MNDVIVSRTVTGPGSKSRPPMATYCEPSQRAIIRARDQQAGQCIERDRREAMALLRVLEPEPRRERPAEDNLPDYEGAALEQAGEGNAVILTGAGPVWLYLRLAHAIHGKAISLHYTSPVTGLVEIFNHNPF